jgi:hypothetical protein
LPERFDAGTGLVALGGVLLLVSLFIDWFTPGGDAWAVFEIADILLAALGVAAILAALPRPGGLERAGPAIAYTALVVVAVQLIDQPPAARGAELETGAWLALAGALVMALGATLSAASISVTVDVQGRERRRRTAAIDAREAERAADAEAADAPAEPAAPEAAPEEPAAKAPARRTRRRTKAAEGDAAGAGAVASGATASGEAGESGGGELWRGRRGHAADAEGSPPPREDLSDDPQRTQALDPVDRPGEGA